MNDITTVLQTDEQAVFVLRALYRQYGYSQYKMSKFEEYDLYVRNKDFLVSDRVITFTDTNGKLMALKPDVTLSIIKNFHDSIGSVQKLYYNENVYRIPKGSYGFREIMQVGLECLGDVDRYNLCEVILLAVQSLKTISTQSVLDISHMGFVTGVLEAVPLQENQKNRILQCIGEKNLSGIQAICREEGLQEEQTGLLTGMASAYGKLESVLGMLQPLNINNKTDMALKELENICHVLKKSGLSDWVQLDFSVVNDMAYYSGIVFRGYVNGIASGILSGGQYDKLMEKMGKSAGAIGFAVYLDLLRQQSSDDDDYDTDVLLLYDEQADMATLVEKVQELIEQGLRVMTQKTVPDKIRYKKLYRVTKEGIKRD